MYSNLALGVLSRLKIKPPVDESVWDPNSLPSEREIDQLFSRVTAAVNREDDSQTLNGRFRRLFSREAKRDCVQLVDDHSALDDCVRALHRQRHDGVAFDAEGTRLGRRGKLCLLQLAAAEGPVYVVDVLTLGPEYLSFGPLKVLLEDPTVVKLSFDCRRDSDALMHQFGVKLTGCWDIQLADVLARREDGQLVRFVRGYVGCLRQRVAMEITSELVAIQGRTKVVFEEDPMVWERRPLSDDMLIYAASDVAMMHRLRDVITQDLANVENAKERVLRASGAYEAELRDAAEDYQGGSTTAPEV